MGTGNIESISMKLVPLTHHKDMFYIKRWGGQGEEGDRKLRR